MPANERYVDIHIYGGLASVDRRCIPWLRKCLQAEELHYRCNKKGHLSPWWCPIEFWNVDDRPIDKAMEVQFCVGLLPRFLDFLDSRGWKPRLHYPEAAKKLPVLRMAMPPFVPAAPRGLDVQVHLPARLIVVERRSQIVKLVAKIVKENGSQEYRILVHNSVEREQFDDSLRRLLVKSCRRQNAAAADGNFQVILSRDLDEAEHAVVIVPYVDQFLNRRRWLERWQLLEMARISFVTTSQEWSFRERLIIEETFGPPYHLPATRGVSTLLNKVLWLPSPECDGR